jgi:hypothetical protein
VHLEVDHGHAGKVRVRVLEDVREERVLEPLDVHLFTHARARNKRREGKEKRGRKATKTRKVDSGRA